MRYLIVAAIIRNDDRILLVQQQGSHDPAPAWALPGGVAHAGELIDEALVREVQEETGLLIEEIGAPAYSAQVDHVTEHYQSLTFVFEVRSWSGTLHPTDPDQLILAAQFCTIPDALEKLQALPWRVMREPLMAYLRGEMSAGSVWLYRQDGDDARRIALLSAD